MPTSPPDERQKIDLAQNIGLVKQSLKEIYISPLPQKGG